MLGPAEAWRRARHRWKFGPGHWPYTFGLVLLFYQRDPVYALGIAALSAFVRRAIGDVRVHLVPVTKGQSEREIARIVRSLEPHLIGVSAMSPTWLPLDPYLRAIDAALPQVPILAGGYQAMLSPEETLAHPAVDFVCTGDGEIPLVALIERMRGQREGAPDDALPGLWEKLPDGQVRKGTPFLIQNLSDLPFPDYTIFERRGSVRYLSPHAIEAKRLTTLPVISGRGCPYRCTYCANTTLLDRFKVEGGFLRKHEPAALAAELVRLRDRYGIEFFEFWDEEFLYDLRYVRPFLEVYAREVRVPFSVFARVENLDDEVCGVAAEAGCHSVWFGVESGSERYRREHLGRRMSDDRIVAASESARRAGIKRLAFSMVGMPFESLDEARRTLDLTRTLDPELAVYSQFLPFPGTPLHAVCEQHDLLLQDSVDRQMWPLGELNIREHEGGMTGAEMRDVGGEIMRYLAGNTRFDT
jgi:radical SAM superfamily enzyme YgiQ (UPF0313 family)